MADESMPAALPRAASAVLLRGAADGAGASFEVFLLQRPARARFAPGAYAFPGGVLEEQDRAFARDLLAGPDGARFAALRRRIGGDHSFAAPDEATGAALLASAARELFEETGVLLARDGRGAPVALSDEGRRRAWREDLLAGREGFAAILAAGGLRLHPDDLIAFSHWITPAGSPIRYNTHFFLGVLPPGQAAAHDARESAGGLWLAPREALERHARGDLPMLPVQREHLARFAAFDTLDALLDHARIKAIPPVLPVLGADRREVALAEEIGTCW